MSHKEHLHMLVITTTWRISSNAVTDMQVEIKLKLFTSFDYIISFDNNDITSDIIHVFPTY